MNIAKYLVVCPFGFGLSYTTFHSVVQPVQILPGFRRIHPEGGSSATVKFDLGAGELSIPNGAMERVVEPGPVDILVGSNSADTARVRLMVTP